RRKELGASFTGAQDHAAGLLAQCEALELEWQTMRLAVDEAERTAQTAADALAEANARAQAEESQRLRWEDRRRHLDDDRGRIRVRREQLDARLVETARRLDASTADRQAALDRREQVQSRSAELDGAYARAREAADRADEILHRAEQERTESEHAYLRAVSESEAAARRQEEVEQHREDLRRRQSQNREAIVRATDAITRFEGEIAAAASDLERARTARDAAQKAVTEVETGITRTGEEIRQRHERLAEWREGRAMMASLIARGEGLGRAAAAVLSDTDRWSGRVTAWIDRLHPAPEWSAAVESVLADRTGALMCRDADAARELVNHLMQGSLGPAIVFDPSLLHGGHDTRPAVSDPAFVGWLSDQIDCSDEDKAWVRALFGTVALVRTADQARRLYGALNGAITVAAADGVVITPPGTVKAGSEEGEPVVGRIDRLKAFDERITNAEITLTQSEESLRVLIASRAGKSAELDAAARAVASTEGRVSQSKLALEAESARRDEYRRLDQEWTAGLDQSADSGAGRSTAGSETELRQRRDETVAHATETETAAAAAEEELNRIAAGVNQVRVELVEAQAGIDAAEAERRRCTEMQSEIRAETDELVGRLNEIDAELQELQTRLDDVTTRVKELNAECERRDADREAARTELTGRREALAGAEARLRDARQRRDEAERRRASVELARSKIIAEADQWRRHILDAHEVDLATAEIEDPDLTDEQLQERGQAAQRAIERVGPVNPLALEEWEREKERLSFLEAQIGDLQDARKSLSQTIVELNETAGRRFVETFDAARVYFQEVFTELFRGGEADVRLIDPERPLESPIEIYARPRGKKFIGIRQLSGGERALTALALLFALYLVKPSPFCILDEVDAPLDDANCNRFLRLLHRFKSRTQFIVVTHNKLTMDAAEILYGVTMENPGISKIVSVRLTRSEAGEHAQLSEADIVAVTDDAPVVASAPRVTPAVPPEN
ncbi:MAG TPA: AAA family ATPase, partial [Acidobacteriota bacterium]|nr:AAA family ATPase [Acidobacteriota bacterium]